MPEERQQFRVLYRDFLRRIIDLEVLSAQGDIEKLLGQFATALAAFNFTYLVVFGPRFVTSGFTPQQVQRFMAGQIHFLVGTTMMGAGLFAVLAWNTILPDRRDALILGVLPVRTRTLFLAKLAAVASVLAGVILALNVFTGLMYPFVGLPADAGFVAAARSFVAYWATMASAGLFVCCAIFALEGVAAQLLPYRLFLRVSGVLQLGAFFTVLGTWLLQPPRPPAWLPSAWFLDWHDRLKGAAGVHPLAGRAVLALLAGCTLAFLPLGLAYARSVRQIVEQPDILPGARKRRHPAVLYTVLRRPIDRAIVLFTARTIARSRQHRLYLAAYAGVGLAIAFGYARDLIYGSRDPYASKLGLKWDQPNVPLMIAAPVLIAFAVMGARAIFSLPVTLPANWLFRLTQVAAPRAYFEAVRKAMATVVVVPLLVLGAAAYFAIWPARPAAEHVLVMCLVVASVAHRSLHQFRKIPFTCSYLPGKSGLHTRIAIYAIGLLAFASFAVQIEYVLLNRALGFSIYCGVGLLAALWTWRRWRRFADSPYNWLQFEDLPPADIESLDLHSPPPLMPAEPLPPLEPGISARPGSILTLHTAVEASPPVPFGARLEQFASDWRAAMRIFRTAPGFSAAAVALLAVGIGGNTAVFSTIHAILDRPAPGVRAERLVNIASSLPDDPDGLVIAFPIFSALAANARTVESISADAFQRIAMTAGEGTYELRGLAVTPNYFETLGVPIVVGRAFTAGENRGAAGLPAIIAYHVWQNQFQSDREIVGRQVLLNGAPATIVGVSAPGFRGTHFAPNYEIAVPILAYAPLRGGSGGIATTAVEALARLATGVTLAQAQAEFDAFSARVREAYPQGGRLRIVASAYSATSFGPWQSAQARMFMALLTGVALLTLLVVCANVANLVLGRSAARQRELAVRQSLGASRGRILSLLLCEGLLLSVAAAAAAWGFAWWASRAIPALIPPLPSGARIQPDLAPDWRVAAYALLLAIAGALAFTLAPSLRAWRLDLLPFLKAGEQGMVRGGSRLANGLAVVQLAFCVLLLGGAGLAARSIALLDAEDLGYPKDHRLILRVNTLAAAGAADRQAMLENLRQRIGAIHGVIAVSYASAVPPDPFGQFRAAVGQTAFGGMLAGPGFMEALGVKVEGRDFREADRNRDAAVITRSMAAKLFPGASALGRGLALFGRQYEVIGIAPDADYAGLRAQGGDRMVFVSYLPNQAGGVDYFNIRYAGALDAVAAPVRGLVRDLSTTRRMVGTLQTMDSFLEQYTAPALLIAGVLSLFSAGALIVAGIGLYAVIAFHTARRTREFGIRLALGATTRELLWVVSKQGVALAAAGSLAGLALSVAAGRLMSGFLFGVTPVDPFTWAAVLGLLSVVTLAACWIPARRAARIQPLEALRQE